MQFKQNIYFKGAIGSGNHRKVTPEELYNLVGYDLGNSILQRANQVIETRKVPKDPTLQAHIDAFFEGRIAGVLVAHSLTNHWDVFVQLENLDKSVPVRLK